MRWPLFAGHGDSFQTNDVPQLTLCQAPAPTPGFTHGAYGAYGGGKAENSSPGETCPRMQSERRPVGESPKLKAIGWEHNATVSEFDTVAEMKQRTSFIFKQSEGRNANPVW